MTLVKRWNHYNISIQQVMIVLYLYVARPPQVHKLLNTCNSNVLINSSLCFCSPTHDVGNRNELGCCVLELRASKNIYCSQRLHWMGGWRVWMTQGSTSTLILSTLRLNCQGYSQREYQAGMLGGEGTGSRPNSQTLSKSFQRKWWELKTWKKVWKKW